MYCGMVKPLPLKSGKVSVTLLGEVSDAPNRMAKSEYKCSIEVL